jgi:hypothetical protein
MKNKIETLSDFINNSIAIKQSDGSYLVSIIAEPKIYTINACSEYQAKENTYIYIIQKDNNIDNSNNAILI